MSKVKHRCWESKLFWAPLSRGSSIKKPRTHCPAVPSSRANKGATTLPEELLHNLLVFITQTISRGSTCGGIYKRSSQVRIVGKIRQTICH